MGGFQLCDVTASSHMMVTEFLGCSSKSWPPYRPCPIKFASKNISNFVFRMVHLGVTSYIWFHTQQIFIGRRFNIRSVTYYYNERKEFSQRYRYVMCIHCFHTSTKRNGRLLLFAICYSHSKNVSIRFETLNEDD